MDCRPPGAVMLLVTLFEMTRAVPANSTALKPQSATTLHHLEEPHEDHLEHRLPQDANVRPPRPKQQRQPPHCRESAQRAVRLTHFNPRRHGPRGKHHVSVEYYHTRGDAQHEAEPATTTLLKERRGGPCADAFRHSQVAPGKQERVRGVGL